MDIVARHAEAQPDKSAVIDGDQHLTWREFYHARNRLADALGALGLVGGEHVVLYAHNSLEVLLASAAARALGLIPVPMNPRLTAEEVAYILDDSDAVAVFVSDAFVPMLERVPAGAPPLRHVVLLGGERRAWASQVNDLIADGRPDPVAVPEGLGGSMIYTAGTTGKPKGALRKSNDPRAIRTGVGGCD